MQNWRKIGEKCFDNLDAGLRFLDRYYLTFFISLFIFFAIGTLLKDYAKLGEKEGIDIYLQVLGFTFVLATILLTLNNNAFSAKQMRTMHNTGCLFIVSGVLMIFGFGVAIYGFTPKEESWLRYFIYVGVTCYGIAVYMLSWGIAVMGRVSLSGLVERSNS